MLRRLLPLAVLVLAVGCASLTPLELTRDGQPAATIVIADAPTKPAAAAAADLRDHLEKISGARLPIVGAGTGVSGTRILVGASAATEALGLRNTDFASQEYLVERRGSDLILMGRDTDAGYGLSVRGAPTWADGPNGKVLSFDGEHDALELAPPGFADVRGSMSVWFRAAPEAKGGTLVRLDGRDPWSYHIVSTDGPKVVYTTYDGKHGNRLTSPEFSPGWHHVRVTWDAETARQELFVDGTSVGQGPYSKTTCATTRVQIGACLQAGPVQGCFKGELADIRIEPGVHLPLNEGAGEPHLKLTDFSGLELTRATMPNLYEDCATGYAVHHFLERDCGVRWYGPTDICTDIPAARMLAVRVRTVRRQPTFAWRCVMPQHAFVQLMRPVAGLWDNPTVDQMWLYAYRMRNGGEKFTCTHAFYGWYDSFWAPNPRAPERFVEQRPDYFAKGYEGQPPQLCYTNPDVVDLVVADARHYFDGKGAPPHGEPAAGDIFALGAMDNSRYCQCPKCQAALDTPMHRANIDIPHFSNGEYSDYWFTFCNAVARGVAKTTPGKYLSTLAYSRYTQHPAFDVEPNVAVQLALAGNTWFRDPGRVAGRHLWGLYQEWMDREPDQRFYLWLYPEFPESSVWSRGYTCFPGFRPHAIGEHMQRYARDGIRGLFPESITTQLNEYVYNQMAFDAGQDPDRLIEEFFRRYYGAAAKPMRTICTEIEDAFCDPANWGPEVVTGDRDAGITEEISWDRLGTAERMARWQGCMDEAKRLARTDTEKARVRLFETAEWEPMVAARAVWLKKAEYLPGVKALQTAPPPTATAAAVPAAGGDLDKVDWAKADALTITHTHEGYPAARAIAVQLAHDADWLYLRLVDPEERAGIDPRGGFWSGDRWEIFVGAQCGAKEYLQFAIKADGRLTCLTYPGSQAVATDAKVSCVLDDHGWTTMLAAPLAPVRAFADAAPDTLYLNLYRPASANRPTLAWSPNFLGSGYNTSKRLGKVTLK